MTEIIFDRFKHKYDVETKTFFVNERDLNYKFDTDYTIVSPRGQKKTFKLSHSTGSEWDPNTKYIYKCDDMTLEVAQDPTVTKQRANAYLSHKLYKD